jgi:release factor glutamine methyltransferase
LIARKINALAFDHVWLHCEKKIIMVRCAHLDRLARVSCNASAELQWIKEAFGADNHDAIERVVHRRTVVGEPLQYIVGVWPFRRVQIELNEHVLIPRPETEQLVSLCFNSLRRIISKTKLTTLTAVDVGTGSGCIAASLANEANGELGAELCVHATDTDQRALDVARRNVARNGVCVHFHAPMDLLEAVGDDGCFDLIVANLPYLAESERGALDREVVDFEPPRALFAHADDALHLIERLIARDAPRLLRSGGSLLLEHGIDVDGERISSMAPSTWHRIDHCDYTQRHRFTELIAI